MNRYIVLIITAFTLLLVPCNVIADKKKKHVEVRPELPMPDLRIPALKAHKTVAPLHEIGNPKTYKQGVYMGVQGNHTASDHGGIDVSHYQGQINWSQVARSGKVLYAFCKATESNNLMDNTFQYNVREARKVGIPVGCYHFFRPNVSGEAQLKYFIENVDMSTQDVVPMLDIEIRGKASLEEFQKQIRAWLKGFEEHYHFKPIIYASVNFYNKYLAGAFDDYMYMIAKYGEGVPSPQGPIPFAMWQYSASGRIEGIKGAVDRSCFVDHFHVKDILIKNQR